MTGANAEPDRANGLQVAPDKLADRPRPSITQRPGGSLRRRLTILMASLAVAPVLISVTLLHLRAREAIRSEVLQHMQSVAESKGLHLEQLMRERLDDAETLAQNVEFRRRVAQLAEGGLAQAETLQSARAGVSEALRCLTEIHPGYYEAVAVDARTGKVLAWGGRWDEKTVLAAVRPYGSSRFAKPDQPWVSDAHLQPLTQEPTVDVIAPIEAPNSEPGPEREMVAILVLPVNLTRSVFSYLDDRTGMGETGEVVLVDRSLKAMKGLRYDPAAALQRPISALPSTRAAMGETATIEAEDYRGVRVLAAYRHLPLTGWGLVAKMDAREAYAPIHRLTAVSAALVAIVAALAVLAARRAARLTARPILELSAAARKVAKGDLSVRVTPGTADEIGLLAVDFSTMVDQLGMTYDRLEAIVAERTAELAQANLDLHRTNEEMEAFVYTVSHDLTAPLVSLDGMTGILLRDFSDKLGEEGVHRLQRLQANVERMSALVGDLLELSRIGRVMGEERELTVRDLAVKAVQGMAQTIEERGVEIVLPCAATCRVRGDENRIVQVLGNLLSNAVKYMGEQESPRIEVRCEEVDGMLRVSVSDNGVGIDPAYHQGIFRPCFRLPQAKDMPGTGMGLSIVKKIVEAQGGRVWVESDRGKGATFHFTLRKAVAQDE